MWNNYPTHEFERLRILPEPDFILQPQRRLKEAGLREPYLENPLKVKNTFKDMERRFYKDTVGEGNRP